MNDQVVRICS